MWYDKLTIKTQEAIQLAENSIFLGKVHVARRQTGCMRFSYVPLGSRTPKRYHCQPDLVRQQVETDTEKIGYSEEDETRKVIKKICRKASNFKAIRVITLYHTRKTGCSVPNWPEDHSIFEYHHCSD